MAKSFWMADQKGNYSNDKNDTFDENKDYLGVRMQQGVPLLDRDWNELEDIRRYQDMMLRKNYICDGTPDNGFEIIKADDVLDFKISRGRYLVDGIEAVNHDAIHYKKQREAKPLTKPIAERTDLVYIELTVNETNGPENEQDICMPTCRRHEVQWLVKVNEGSNDLPKPEQFKWRTPVALLKRNGDNMAIEDHRHKNNGFNRDFGDLRVNGILTVEKETKLNEKLDVLGKATLSELAVNKHLTSDSVDVNGDASIKKLLYLGQQSVCGLSAKESGLFSGLEISCKNPADGKFSKVCEMNNGIIDYPPRIGHKGLLSTFYSHLYINLSLDDENYVEPSIAQIFLTDAESNINCHLVRINADGKVAVSNAANDSCAIGVVCYDPAVIIDTIKEPKIPHKDVLDVLEKKVKKGLLSKDLFNKFKGGSANLEEVLHNLKDSDELEVTTHKIPVVLSGYAKCVAEDGIILGDLLTSSGKGRVKKAQEPIKTGTIIGKALSDSDGISVKMLVFHA